MAKSFVRSNSRLPQSVGGGEEDINWDQQTLETDLETNLKTYFPLHYAAYKGYVKKFKELLSSWKYRRAILSRDSENKTPLHHACCLVNGQAAHEIVEAIVSLGEDAINSIRDIEDTYGKKAIHYSIHNGHLEVVKKLYVKEELPVGGKYILYRSTALYHAIHSGKLEIINELLARGAQLLPDDTSDEQVQKVVVNLFNHMPLTSITHLYDGSVTENKENNENAMEETDAMKIDFDFRPVVGYLGNQDKVERQMETKWLYSCIRLSNKRKNVILLHPVVQAFMDLKWTKFRPFLWASIAYHIIWMLLYTLFVWNMYIFKCSYQNYPDGIKPDPEALGTASHNKKESFGNGPVEQVCDASEFIHYLQIEVGLLLFISATIAVKELYELATGFKLYFRQWENLGQWLIIGVILYTAAPVALADSENNLKIVRWQFQGSAYGMFLAWVLILNQIGKYPRLTIYIDMLGKVLRSFLLFIATFGPLFVAFMIAFMILLPEKHEFYDFPWSIIKLLTMMTGEINYDELFYGDLTDFEVPFFLSTKLICATFVALVTIGLLNLLIGLTVSDIQKLQGESKVSSMASQLEAIFLIESFLMSARFQRMLGPNRSWIIEKLFVMPKPKPQPSVMTISVLDDNNLTNDVNEKNLQVTISEIESSRSHVVTKTISEFPSLIRHELRELINNQQTAKTEPNTVLDDELFEYLKSALTKTTGTLKFNKSEFSKI